MSRGPRRKGTVHFVPYPRQLLNPGEEIALDMHPHWWFFARQGAALVASVVVAILVAVYTGGDGFAAVLRWLSIAAVVVSVVWFGLRWIAWVTTHFVVTSDRVIFREGVLRRRGIEIPLGRVNNVLFDTPEERYKMITGQVKDLCYGLYGKTAVPINAEVQKKALKGYSRGEEPITCRPAEVLEPELEKAKKELM